MKLKEGNSYAIGFVDPEQATYTWHTGTGIFIHELDDDFGTGEQHYLFRLSDGDECAFPKSSILGPAVKID